MEMFYLKNVSQKNKTRKLSVNKAPVQKHHRQTKCFQPSPDRRDTPVKAVLPFSNQGPHPQ